MCVCMVSTCGLDVNLGLLVKRCQICLVGVALDYAMRDVDVAFPIVDPGVHPFGPWSTGPVPYLSTSDHPGPLFHRADAYLLQRPLEYVRVR